MSICRGYNANFIIRLVYLMKRFSLNCSAQRKKRKYFYISKTENLLSNSLQKIVDKSVYFLLDLILEILDSSAIDPTKG